VRRWIVPLACLAVAVAALVAALLTPREGTRKGIKPVQLTRVVSPRSAGVTWASLDTPGPVAVSARGTYWLAFRGFAVGGNRTLALQGGGGARWSATVGTKPAIHFFGPLVLQGAASYWLTPTDPSSADLRAGEKIFYADFRLFPRPLAVLPGPGFWPEELDTSSGTPLNWLNERGAVDVASYRPIERVWLSFDASSVDRQRTLTVAQGARSYRVSVPERGATKHVTVGPFTLRAGAARVLFSCPGGVITGRDARTRSVRVSRLEARATAPGS
jgi:hypothetical protein